MKIKSIFRAILVLLLSFFAGKYLGEFILSPMSMDQKIGVFLLPFISIVFILSPMLGFMILLSVRGLVNIFSEFYIIQGLSLLAAFSLVNILFAFYILATTRNVKWFPGNLKWFYIYLLIAILSVLNSPDLFKSIVGLMKLLSLTALFLLGYNLPNDLKDAFRVIKAILISAVPVIIYGIYQLITGQGEQEYRGGVELAWIKLNSTFVLPNPFAFYLGVIILLAVLCIYYSEGKKGNALYIPVLAGALVCLLFTYIRTVWIAVFLAFCMIGYHEKKARKLLVICAILLLPFSWKFVSYRLLDIVTTPEYGFNSVVFRFDMVKQLLVNAAFKHFFFGFGLNSVTDVTAKHTIYTGFVPHNDYLRLLIETGIFGLTAFLVFMGKYFVYLLDLVHKRVNFRANVVFLGLIIFYLSASLADSIFTYISGSGYIFCLMGLSYKINDINKESEMYA